MDYNNRELLILAYITKNKTATAQELADLLYVSPRTIKDDISKLKVKLNVEAELLLSKPGLGYCLSEEYVFDYDSDRLLKEKDLILYNYDRIADIIQILLLNDCYVRLEDLAEKLYVSRSTIQPDMLKIRTYFEKFNLDIYQKPNHGIKVTGTEHDYRQAIFYFVFNSFWAYLSSYSSEIGYLPSQNKIKEIETYIKGKFKKYDIEISVVSLKNFIAQYIISLKRVDKAHELDIKSTDVVIGKEYDMALDIVMQSLGYVEINTVIYLTQYILSVQNDVDNPEKYLNLAKIVLHEINNNFQLDFRNDDEIIQMLSNYVSHLSCRIKYCFKKYDTEAFSFFGKYLFPLKLTISAVDIIEGELGVEELSVFEYVDLIKIFEYAIEKQLQKKKNIKLYTGNDNLDQKVYMQYLSNYLDGEKYTVEYIKDVDRNEFNTDDILLSTRKLNHPLSNLPLVIERVNKNRVKKLDQEIENYNKFYKQEVIEQYICEDSLLIIDTSSITKVEEVNNTIIDYLYRNNYLKDNLETIDAKFAYNEIGNRSVHIQDLSKLIKERICLIVFLTNPIVWEHTLVDTLFLIKTKRDEDADLKILCDIFSSWVSRRTNDIKQAEITIEGIKNSFKDSLD